jgi:hypothetical protein
MTDDPSMVDQTKKSNVEPLFRGKQTVREMIRTLQEENQRQFESIKQRLDAIEKSL